MIKMDKKKIIIIIIVILAILGIVAKYKGLF